MTTVLIEWCFLTALGFLLLAHYSWTRSTERVGKVFEIMLVFTAVWVGGYGIEILGAAYAGVTWAYIGFVFKMIGYTAAPICLTMFSLFYTGSRPIASMFLILVAPLAASLGTVISNPSTGWFLSSLELIDSGLGFPALQGQPGFGLNLTTKFHTVVLIVGVVALALSAFRRSHIYRDPMLAVIVGSTVPILAEILTENATNIRIDLSSLSLGCSLIAFWLALRWRLLQQSPAAWEFAMEQSSDPLVITNELGITIEMNTSAKSILQASTGTAFALSSMSSNTEHDADSKTLLLQRDPLITDSGMRGYSWIFRDITDRKYLEQQLAHQAIHDALTGLLNVRALQDRLSEFQRNIPRTSVSLIMLDIDHFRNFNARRSHLGGNTVLREFANMLRFTLETAAGNPDAIYRFGGDEFCIVLLDTTLDDTLKIAETLRVSATQLSISNLVDPQELTISIGLAATPEQLLGALLSSASDSLSQAKKAGRNRIEKASPGYLWSRGIV